MQNNSNSIQMITPSAADSVNKHNLTARYGNNSAIIQDNLASKELHEENLKLLAQMKEEQIMEERKKLLESMDPSLVALLTKKRQQKAKELNESSSKPNELVQQRTNVNAESVLADSNPALELLEQSNKENWLHFNVIESDKLAWMRDIPAEVAKLKPGQTFEARFDWKGVLLPYSENDLKSSNKYLQEKDERELYLHGEEPQRPGYTLQELFRLARY